MKYWLLILLFPIFISAQSKASNLAAAKTVAENDPVCKKIQPFYWEIGDKASVLASGSAGNGVERSTKFAIASASKFMFGAYAIEKLNGKIDANNAKYLHMSSGYNSLGALSCVGASTVKACFERRKNSEYTAANDGHFFYNGAHFQKWLVDQGLGSLDHPGLTAEYKKYLGAEIPVEWGMLQPAGGIKMSAEGYAIFLQKILQGKLKIHDQLGGDPVCTMPSSCPGKAIRSPVPIAWHYSYGHWVEDDPETGDGSFSSPGAFGFYPWIDKSKTYYGIISRHQFGRGPDQMGAGYGSAICGAKIRRAALH